MKRKWVWAVVAVLALAGLGAGGWFFLRAKEDDSPQGGVATARSGDYLITVTEEGSFQARKSINLTIAVQAFHQQMTITMIVEEGKTVQKDEVLLELDKSEINRIISQAEVELQTEKNNVVQANEELRIQGLINDLSIQRAHDRLRNSKAALKKWEELEEPRRVKEAQIRIDDADQAVLDAEREFTARKRMEKEDLVSKAEVQKAEVAYNKARTNLELAHLGMRLLKDYDNPKETALLKFNQADDEMFLSSETVAVTSRLNQKQAALLRAETGLRNKEEHLKKLTSDRDLMTVKSPSDGIVLYGDPRQRMYGWGMTQELKVGGKIHPHNPLLSVPDLTAFKVNLQVNEGDVNKVKDGLTAEIRPEAIPNTTFKGKVVKVSKVSGQQQWWAADSGSAKFDVEIEVEGVDPRIRPGMKCKTEILIEEVKGVVHVPVDAVFEKEGKTLCYVLGSKPEPRVVKTGRANPDVIEILEGLKAGDQVTLYDPTRGHK